jgi:hypothetical protein
VAVADAVDRMEPADLGDPSVAPVSADANAPRWGHGRQAYPSRGGERSGGSLIATPSMSPSGSRCTARNLGEPSLEWAHGVRTARPDVPRRGDRRRARHADGSARPDRRGRLWDVVPDRADPGLPGVPPGGGAHGPAHRSGVRLDPRALETTAEVLAPRGVPPTSTPLTSPRRTPATLCCPRSRTRGARSAPGFAASTTC